MLSGSARPLALIALACVWLWPGTARGQSGTEPDWARDWVVDHGFALDVDAQGFRFPTAIAFVPEPGPAPDDPLYFVTELRGRLLVVTNDRTVHTFADGIVEHNPAAELPAEAGEIGVAGLCLAPEHGYVFVTFPYLDGDGVLRNTVLRFETEPRTFARAPRSQTSFAHVFAADRSSHSHQVGPCQVEGDLLYVTVGDAIQMYESRNIDSTLGKVLRMTLDGQPAPGNPFADPADAAGSARARDYVWAIGFRNPFSLRVLNDRVFVADNGLAVDRFLEVHAGSDYLWDGSDWSIATNSAAVIVPAPSPVQMDYLPPDATLFPAEYGGHFFVATSGLPSARGSDRPGAKGVMMLPYDTAVGRMVGAPRTLLQYRGSGYQSVVGAAFGPDGLYVAPLLPFPGGDTPILRVRHAPAEAHPYLATNHVSPNRVLRDRACYGCHNVEPDVPSVGPSLDREGIMARVGERVSSESFEAELLANAAAVDLGDNADIVGRLLAAEGADRIRWWIAAKVLEPRLDNPNATMPNLGLTRGEATLIADYLLGLDQPPPDARGRVKALVRSVIPEPRYRHIGMAFGIGFLVPLLLGASVVVVRRSRVAR
jgi:glucose/arabinose dehydrogenase